MARRTSRRLVGTALTVVGVPLAAALLGTSPAAGVAGGQASSHATNGTAGTSGIVTLPQPLSTADQTGVGANQQPGPYDSTRNGAPSGNGVGGGAAVGKPCAGCVGRADNKNPPGQMPNGSDRNAGYECDRNQGIGQTNPAHTGCLALVTSPTTTTMPTSPTTTTPSAPTTTAPPSGPTTTAPPGGPTTTAPAGGPTTTAAPGGATTTAPPGGSATLPATGSTPTTTAVLGSETAGGAASAGVSSPGSVAGSSSQATGSAQGALPNTGGDTSTPLALGLSALALGAVLLAAGRRRAPRVRSTPARLPLARP